MRQSALMNLQCLLTNSCLLKCVLCLYFKHSIFKMNAGWVHLISPSLLRCSSAPSHQPSHLVKKCSRDAEPWLSSWFPDKFDQMVGFLEKLNTFFNAVSQSYNWFSNIVNVTIIGMARPKNLLLHKLVGEIRVTTDIISSWCIKINR